MLSAEIYPRIEEPACQGRGKTSLQHTKGSRLSLEAAATAASDISLLTFSPSILQIVPKGRISSFQGENSAPGDCRTGFAVSRRGAAGGHSLGDRITAATSGTRHILARVINFRNALCTYYT